MYKLLFSDKYHVKIDACVLTKPLLNDRVADMNQIW